MSTSKSWPAAWMLSWLWLANIDQLAAPASGRATSNSVSSNIMFRMWYSMPLWLSRFLSDWTWEPWQSRALITWAALAPPTSLADCLRVAVASPKADLNSASGVHCFQAPRPFGPAAARAACGPRFCDGQKHWMPLPAT